MTFLGLENMMTLKDKPENMEEIEVKIKINLHFTNITIFMLTE